MYSNIALFMGRHLSRKTSGRALIPEVDGLRSIAILAVVFFHANANFAFYTGEPKDVSDGVLNRLLDAGEYGVPLFFVISGFILTIPFASFFLDGAQRVSLKKYLVRRVTRLEPPYIFAIFALFLIGVLRTGSFENLPNFLASVSYLHNAIYQDASAITAVAWSLEVEVQFYLLAPIITLVFAVHNAAIRRAILLVSITLLSYFFNVVKPIDGLNIVSHGSYFLVGLFLADIYLADRRRYIALGEPENDQHCSTRINGGYLFDMVVVLAISMVFVCKAYDFWPELVSPWLILIGYAAVFRARVLRGIFRFKPVVILGGMCYTIYLWHFFVIAGFRHIWFRVVPVDEGLISRVLYVLSASVVAIVFSAILFALIERPTMDPKWPQKLWGSRGSKPQSGSGS